MPPRIRGATAARMRGRPSPRRTRSEPCHPDLCRPIRDRVQATRLLGTLRPPRHSLPLRRRGFVPAHTSSAAPRGSRLRPTARRRSVPVSSIPVRLRLHGRAVNTILLGGTHTKTAGSIPRAPARADRARIRPQRCALPHHATKTDPTESSAIRPGVLARSTPAQPGGVELDGKP